MTLVLGFDNSRAKRLLAKHGQPMKLVETIGAILDPVAGATSGGFLKQTTIQGYPFPASAQYAQYYGFVNVTEKDVLCFVEAIIEPNEDMQIWINGEVFQIVNVKAITDAGVAKLFVIQARQ